DRDGELVREHADPTEQHLAITMAPPPPCRLAVVRTRQREQRVADKRELAIATAVCRAAYDATDRMRRHRQLGGPGGHAEPVTDPDRAALQRAAVAFGEHRQQHAIVAEPVDVEEMRV